MHGTVEGGRRQSRHKKGGKTTSGKWTGLEFAKYQSRDSFFAQMATENREKWRKLIVKSSVAPQRPPRLRDR